MSLGERGSEPAPTTRRYSTADLRALAHPVRLRILSLLTATPMTAAEVARELKLTHANASYHLRQLHATGVLDIAGEERIRGGVAKRYRYDVTRDLDRPPTPPDADPAATPDAATLDPRMIYAALATELRRRSSQLLRGPGNFLADAEFWVDPDDWREIRDAVAAATDRLHRSAQPPRSPGTVRVSATLALFRMED
ncbi:MAG TPA: helix-turn-helix domain-containing protein [Micromonosporaceae bacterium]